MSEDEKRADEARAIRAMILGVVTGSMLREDWPLKIRDVVEWYDEDEIIQAVSVITSSGLRYRVSVVYEGEEPEEM